MTLVHSGSAFVPTEQADKPAASVADILDRAADLIAPEGAWTQGALARCEDGTAYVDELPPDPTCFCAEGAIQSANGRRGAKSERAAFDALRRVIPTDFIHEWNDRPTRTQAEVVTALRRAAAAERAKAAGAAS